MAFVARLPLEYLLFEHFVSSLLFSMLMIENVQNFMFSFVCFIGRLKVNTILLLVLLLLLPRIDTSNVKGKKKKETSQSVRI